MPLIAICEVNYVTAMQYIFAISDDKIDMCKLLLDRFCTKACVTHLSTDIICFVMSNDWILLNTIVIISRIPCMR